MCDFRNLNDVTKRDTYPSQDIVDKMEDIVFWSTLDAASAYWSIPLNEADKEKTTFSVPCGKYGFNVTPFGLCNAGASYQRMVDIYLSGLPSNCVFAYIDDILICSKSMEEHLSSLKEVFLKLRESGITLKLSKCVFGCENIDFLGYNLSKDGIKPQKRLTEAIKEFKIAENKKELKRFLGMANFYRKFIPQFSRITKPLNNLTSDAVKFAWDIPCDDAFTHLRTLLTSYPLENTVNVLPT